MTTPASVFPGPSVDADDALFAAFAADLDAAGYTVDRLRECWGDAIDAVLGRGSAVRARRALGPDSPAGAASTIARLFGLGDAVARAAVEAAFPNVAGLAVGAVSAASPAVAGLAALGLVRADGEQVTPTALVRPHEIVDTAGVTQWWFASDLDEAALRARGASGALPTDHVLGVGGASTTLAEIVLPTEAGRVLDLGTGCGVQALRARRFAASVIATDISARALAFAAFNARLNGVTGIETRRGSLFEPVAGERFDRIVSNPPFVITPREAGVPAFEYRDGGLEGDALVFEVIAGAAGALAPGGVAQLLGNWESRGEVSGLDRVRDAVDAGIDAWVIERESLSPAAYAELWIRDGGTVPGSPEFDALLAAWLDDFERRGVTGVGFGYVLLRLPAAGSERMPRLSRFERVTHPIPAGSLGAHFAAALAAHDALAGLDDAALARCRFVVAGDVTEARHFMPGADDPSVIELRQGGGLGRTLSVDPALAGVVGACDGELPLGVLCDAVAELLGADAAALRAEVFPRMRELAFTGFVALAER